VYVVDKDSKRANDDDDGEVQVNPIQQIDFRNARRVKTVADHGTMTGKSVVTMDKLYSSRVAQV
jgi:hypothetical protein